MTRRELLLFSEGMIRKLLKDSLPAGSRVFLYGSRARGDNRWNSDYDLWIDAELPRAVLRDLDERLEESSIPFRIDLDALENGRAQKFEYTMELCWKP